MERVDLNCQIGSETTKEGLKLQESSLKSHLSWQMNSARAQSNQNNDQNSDS